jgi:hypothetical protein
MADEIEREVTEDDDVEGQRMSNRIRSGRTDDERGPGSDEVRLAHDEDDVEGQMFVRTRNR